MHIVSKGDRDTILELEAHVAIQIKPDGRVEPRTEESGLIDTQPGITAVPEVFLCEDPSLSDDMIRRVAAAVDADIKREWKLIERRRRGLAPLGPIVRAWETKVAEAYRIWEALGQPKPGDRVIVNTALVQKVMPVAHVGVQEYLASLSLQPAEDSQRTVYVGCHWEVQTGMTVELIRAFDGKDVLGNIRV